MRSVLVVACIGLMVTAAGPAVAGDLRDPTRPPEGGQARPADPAPSAALQLDFLVASAGRRLARINGQWVREGETVDGAKVLRIKPDRVVVLRGGHTKVLRLSGSGIHKNTNGKR